MKNGRLNVIINKILMLILLLLIVSNIFFYSKFKELNENTNYVDEFSSAISIAGNSNDMSFLYSHFSPNNLDNLENKFKEIKPKIGSQYSTSEYITLEYKNGNILAIKTTQNDKGKFFIEDMFILDK